MESTIPILDISGHLDVHHNKDQDQAIAELASRLRDACLDHGFFYIVGHGVDSQLLEQLHEISKSFFALPMDQKMAIHMSASGKAWRGFFPIREELTSGKPDLKEGLYFGEQHDTEEVSVLMHGKNLYPETLPAMQMIVESYMNAIRNLGDRLIELFAISMGLPRRQLLDTIANPAFSLFRIFHYPSQPNKDEWGVGEHTDYGLLTILLQDDVGGLQIKSKGNWIDAPVIPNTFICNIGDMMERLTGGLYVSTAHRVRNISERSRYSFPFFYDPNWNASLKPLLPITRDQEMQRWDNEHLFGSMNTYGEYISRKVGKVFPDLNEP